MVECRDAMKLNKELWSRLPCELLDRVLSFSAVPDLCRFRSVCKRWNELLCKPSFHDLCDENRKENEYLFVTRHLDYGDFSMIDPKFKRTMSFLDVHARRWYSVKLDTAQRTERMTQLVAMDDGLMCEVTPDTDVNYALIISDPVAKTRKFLPEPPVYCSIDDVLPMIVTTVDTAAGTYKVFVINNSDEEEFRMYVYESSTNNWRGLKDPPEAFGTRTAVSAVSFGGNLYVIFTSSGKFVLLSYNVEEDLWKVLNLNIPKKKRHPQLVVSCNRLFTLMWLGEPCPLTSVQHGSAKKFHLLFEVREVLIAENTSRMMVQITKTHLQQIFGEEDVDFDIPYGIPLINSSGVCKSIVLMSTITGKLILYDLVSGSVDVLPPHPLVPSPSEEDPEALIYYQGSTPA